MWMKEDDYEWYGTEMNKETARLLLLYILKSSLFSVAATFLYNYLAVERESRSQFHLQVKSGDWDLLHVSS